MNAKLWVIMLCENPGIVLGCWFRTGSFGFDMRLNVHFRLRVASCVARDSKKLVFNRVCRQIIVFFLLIPVQNTVLARYYCQLENVRCPKSQKSL